MNCNASLTVVFVLWELVQWVGFVPIVCKSNRNNVTQNYSLIKRTSKTKTQMLNGVILR